MLMVHQNYPLLEGATLPNVSPSPRGLVNRWVKAQLSCQLSTTLKGLTWHQYPVGSAKAPGVAASQGSPSAVLFPLLQDRNVS